MIKSAAYLYLERNGQVLLLKRANTGYRDGQYGLVAGRKEENETIRECLLREVQEEAGLILDPSNLTLAHIAHRLEDGQEWYNFIFTTSSWEGEPINMEPEKCSELSWYPTDALPEGTIPYIAQALDMIRNNVFYSESGWNELLYKSENS